MALAALSQLKMYLGVGKVNVLVLRWNQLPLMPYVNGDTSQLPAAPRLFALRLQSP